MKILCWNTDDAVWKHWNQVINVSASMVRTESFEAAYDVLSASGGALSYCFIYLGDSAFSQQVEGVVRLCSDFPTQKIIVFPNQASQAAAARLFSAGVNGQCAPYIGKDQLELVLSVIDAGEIWGGKAFIQQLIMQSPSISASSVLSDKLADLSEREHKVAEGISRGLSNKEIALEMSITERTIKAHLTSIFKKTGTKDRLSLALLVKG
ncbi:response regulator transcription factor [Marinomonas sp. IMCC 4694]|uniref:response regulator transcription factor n=1 Tax=Marinomonas sp. IMCC 4694 TaxID=2605432 RepID=UPI0011E7A278|nr:response regulator transcription factor [Marinomonas sp. IMCC 4694]TYL48180.1 response regulator transcription factor [Marinomonas sp. IMCC 4694]